MPAGGRHLCGRRTPAERAGSNVLREHGGDADAHPAAASGRHRPGRDAIICLASAILAVPDGEYTEYHSRMAREFPQPAARPFSPLRGTTALVRLE